MCPLGSGYAIKFGSAGLWNFDKELARNVAIFGVDNSSLSHTDNRSNLAAKWKSNLWY